MPQVKTVFFIVILYLSLSLVFGVDHREPVNNHLHIPDEIGIMVKVKERKQHVNQF